MYFDVLEFTEYNELSLSGFSGKIDEFIHRKYDLNDDVAPPHSPSPDGFTEILAGIEGATTMYRTDCAIALLDMNTPSRAKIIEMIKKASDATRFDGLSHSVSMGSPEHSRGFSFVTAADGASDEELYERAASFAMLKKYSEKYDQWFGLGARQDSANAIDVAVTLQFPWQRDEAMEELTKCFLQPGTRVT